MIKEKGLTLYSETRDGYKRFVEVSSELSFIFEGSIERETDVFLEEEQRMESFIEYMFTIAEVTTIEGSRVLFSLSYYTNDRLDREELIQLILKEMKDNYSYML